MRKGSTKCITIMRHVATFPERYGPAARAAEPSWLWLTLGLGIIVYIITMFVSLPVRHCFVCRNFSFELPRARPTSAVVRVVAARRSLALHVASTHASQLAR